MTTPARHARGPRARPGRRVRVARRTRETDITIALDLDGVRPRRHRDRDRLLRPPPGLAGPPRPVRPRDPGDGRPPRRRAPHGRGRGARARAPRSPRRSATGPGSAASATAPCRWTSPSRRPSSTSAGGPYAVIDLPVPRRAGRHAAAPARRPRARVVRPGRGRHAPPARHRPQRPPPRRGRVQGARPRAPRRLRAGPAADRRRVHQGVARVTAGRRTRASPSSTTARATSCRSSRRSRRRAPGPPRA